MASHLRFVWPLAKLFIVSSARTNERNELICIEMRARKVIDWGKSQDRQDGCEGTCCEERKGERRQGSGSAIMNE